VRGAGSLSPMADTDRGRFLSAVRAYFPAVYGAVAAVSSLLGFVVTIYAPTDKNRGVWLVAFGVLFVWSVVAGFRQQRIAIAEKRSSDKRADDANKKINEMHDTWLSTKVLLGEIAAKTAGGAADPRIIGRYRATDANQPHHILLRNFGAAAFDIRIDSIDLGRMTYGKAEHSLEIDFEAIHEIMAGNEFNIRPDIAEDGEYSFQFGHNMYTPLYYGYIGKSWAVAMQTAEGEEIPDAVFRPYSWPVNIRYRDSAGTEFISRHRLQFDVSGTAVLIFERQERAA
jgi:hypothetical protein